MKRYSIGKLHIVLDDSVCEIVDDSFSALFLEENQTMRPDILMIQKDMDVSLLEGAECLTRTGGYELLRTEEGLFLLNHWGTCRFGYGVFLDDLFRFDEISIYVNRKLGEQIPLNISRFLSTVGLHSKLLQKGVPILHASYIDHAGKAILFTAPAQTGKSTQANLWNEITGAEIINGDRVLLRKDYGVWNAYGYPCCGSSMICKNRALPIAAIVVLEQAGENRVEEITAARKIRALISATEIYPWETREFDEALALAQCVAEEVKMVKLSCRPDADAVNVLKTYIEDSAYANLD
jgi:hypothetical protein